MTFTYDSEEIAEILAERLVAAGHIPHGSQVIANWQVFGDGAGKVHTIKVAIEPKPQEPRA